MSLGDPLVAELLGLVQKLIEGRDPLLVTLDELGDVVSDRSITAAQIERLIEGLEGQGVIVSSEQEIDLQGLLKTVIQTAIKLRAAGQPAGPSTIAKESGLSHGAVKLALLYSEVLRG